MRFKNYCALVLAGAMLAGTVGVMNPVTAMAEETSGATSANTYTLTVPKDFAISNSRWNDVGAVTVTKNGTLDDGKQVTVTATSANGFKLVNADASDSTDEKNQIGYQMRTEENGGEAMTFTFDAADINSESGASQEFGVYVDDFGEKAEGNYTDTLTFKAEMSGGGSEDQGQADLDDLFEEHTTVEMKWADGKVVKAQYKEYDEQNLRYVYSCNDGDITTSEIWAYKTGEVKFHFYMILNNNYTNFMQFQIDSEGNVKDLGRVEKLQSIKINGKLFYEAESGDDSGNTGGDQEKADLDDLSKEGTTVEAKWTDGKVVKAQYDKYDMIYQQYNYSYQDDQISLGQIYAPDTSEGKFVFNVTYKDNSEKRFKIGLYGDVNDMSGGLQYIKINGKLFYGTDSGDDSGL